MNINKSINNTDWFNFSVIVAIIPPVIPPTTLYHWPGALLTPFQGEISFEMMWPWHFSVNSYNQVFSRYFEKCDILNMREPHALIDGIFFARFFLIFCRWYRPQPYSCTIGNYLTTFGSGISFKIMWTTHSNVNSYTNQVFLDRVWSVIFLRIMWTSRIPRAAKSHINQILKTVF